MAELDLNVNVNTKGEQKLKGIGGTLAGFGKFAIIGGAAVAGAVGIAGAAFAGMASEAEKSQAKLKSVFDSTGAAAFTSIDALNEHAEALAKSTTFDDDAVKDAQAALLAFGTIAGEQFTGATDAAADLAAFMGTDIATAASGLGKVLADPEKGLGRLSRVIGPLNDEQKKLIQTMVDAGDTAGAQQAILDIVSGKIGTTAEDLAATSGGQMTVALNQLAEAGESIGTLLLPILVVVAQKLAEFAEFVIAAMPTIQAAIAPVISFITGLFSGAGGVVGGLKDVFKIVVDFWVANGPTLMSIAGQVFGAIANVVKSVMPIILELAKVVLPILAAAGTALFAVLDVAFKGIGGAFEVLGNVFTTTADVITGVVSGVVNAFKTIYNAFADFWNSIDISFPQIDVPFFGTIGGFSIGLPDIPRLAQGGIVTKPTLALIGESGPEAVIPLGASQTPGRSTTSHTTSNHRFRTRRGL